MNRNLLARTWLVVTALAAIGLLIGVLIAYVLTGRAERFSAQATLAMLPEREIPIPEVSNFWDVLNRGQATGSAAIVLKDNSWLDAAASAAGVDKSELTLSAGAIPNTTLITVTMKADSPRAAEAALDSVLTDGAGPAATVSGPFRLEVVTSPNGSARSMSPARIQMFGALGIAGLFVGAGAGLVVSRSAQRRSAVPMDNVVGRKHARVTSPVGTDEQVGTVNAEPPSVGIALQ